MFYLDISSLSNSLKLNKTRRVARGRWKERKQTSPTLGAKSPTAIHLILFVNTPVTQRRVRRSLGVATSLQMADHHTEDQRSTLLSDTSQITQQLRSRSEKLL